MGNALGCAFVIPAMFLWMHFIVTTMEQSYLAIFVLIAGMIVIWAVLPALGDLFDG